MTDLVFIEPNKIDAIPFTTSDIIAESANIGYRSVQKMIETHLKRLETFGIMRFEITVSGNAGRPKKVYKLNEEQATLLITFLKNTDVVADFKTNLVREFYRMRSDLTNRKMLRAQLKPIRRELTDEIQSNPDHSKWDYKLYTDLAYKNVLGLNAAQLRKERGADKKAVAIEYMTAEEIEAVAKLTSRIAVLYEMGLAYEQIKAMLANRKMLRKEPPCNKPT